MLFQSPFTCDCWSLDYASMTPDGKSLATVLNDFKVEIRDTSSGNLLSTLRCIDKIDKIQWSPNGRHIFTAMYERNAVHIFTPPTHPTQASARIDGGELGIENVLWSPDSTCLLVVGKYGIRVDIWELRTSKLYAIPCVKMPKTGIQFSPNRMYLALLTRANEHDCLAIHSADDWHNIKTIELDTLDAVSIEWSPDSNYVAVADCQIEHRVVVVNIESSAKSVYEGYKSEKGVTYLCWCMNSHLLAVGSGNNSIHILFMPDWKLLTELSHQKLTRIDNADHYEEETPGKMKKSHFPMKYYDGNYAGINRIEWSRSGKYIVSSSVSMPRSCFIWEIETLTLIHAFTFLTPVASMKWNPVDDILAVCIGTDKLLTWKPTGFRISHAQEAAIQIHLMTWRPDGEALATFDSAAGTCTLSFVLEDDE